MEQRRLGSDVFARPERKQPTSFKHDVANHQRLARFGLIVKRGLIKKEQEHQRANRRQNDYMNQDIALNSVFHRHLWSIAFRWPAHQSSEANRRINRVAFAAALAGLLFQPLK